LYYNSNTTTAIDIYSLAAYVTVIGGTSVTKFSFYAHDALFTKYTACSVACNISAGSSYRYEEPWSLECYINNGTWNTTYPKNGSNNFVFCEVDASGIAGIGGGWDFYIFQSSIDKKFHY